MPLVEACAAAGTHYADLTGETLFMRETIERFDAPAKASGARIVHTCGFDSIPSDIGVLTLHEAAGELTDTTLVVRRVKGGVSGGTVASLKGTVDDVKRDRSLTKVLGRSLRAVARPRRGARARQARPTSAAPSTPRSSTPGSARSSWRRSTPASCAAPTRFRTGPTGGASATAR